MTDHLVTANDIADPFLGIEGLPKHIKRLELVIDAEDIVLIRCEFYPEAALMKRIEAALTPVFKEFALVDRPGEKNDAEGVFE
jgi:hypothetical protein